MPHTLEAPAIMPMAILAREVMREFINKLSGEEFEELESADGCEQLAVVIMDYEMEELPRKLKYAARALARECNKREITGFAVLPLPNAIEHAETIKANGVSMRMVKTFDVMKGKIVIRLDVCGKSMLPEVEVK